MDSFPAGTKEHASLKCMRGSWSDCRNRLVGLGVFRSKHFHPGVGRNLLRLGDRLEGLRGEFGVSLGGPNASTSLRNTFS